MGRAEAFRGGAHQEHVENHGFVYRDVIPPFERYRTKSKPQRKQLPLDTPLKTDQQTLTTAKVERFTAQPPQENDRSPVKVWGYGRDHWVEDGHHRIAAARARGDKTIDVTYRRATGDIHDFKKLPRR